MQVLNISITAAWMLPVVLALRLLLRKAPKWTVCLLWALVAMRLLLPVSIESPWSLLPSAEPIPSTITTVSRPAIQSGVPEINEAVNGALAQHFSGEIGGHTNPLGRMLTTAGALWLAGVAVMLLYSLWSYLRLRRNVRVYLDDGNKVRVCDDIDTPFILGTLRPRIYIPSGLTEEQIRHVLAHERAHLKRGDHLWKPLGFLLLSVHWFNPLLWVAYILLSRDIEQACDEKVIRSMSGSEKKAYSEALFACSSGRRIILACPVAFGEVSVKERVRSVLNYKKPMLWIVVGSLLACGVFAACFLTNPIPCRHDYLLAVTEHSSCTALGLNTYTCSICKESYSQPIPMASHTFDEGVTLTPATCASEGKALQTCSECGLRGETVLPVLPHAFGEEAKIVKGATCIHTGVHEYTCLDCGATEEREIPTNDNHAFVNEVVRAATCTDSGEGIDTCVLCGETQTVTFEKLSHNYQVETVFKATCIHPGTKYYCCSGCGSRYSEQIPTTGHRWNAYECEGCGMRKPSDSRNPYANQFPDTTPQLPVIQWDPTPVVPRPTVQYPTVKTPGIQIWP